MGLREASAVASVLFAVLLLGGAAAAEETSKRADPSPDDESPSSPYDAATRDRAPAGEAFTNEDLERLAEVPPGEALTKPTPVPPAPPRRVQASKPQVPRASAPRPPRPAASKTRNEVDAETRIATLEARVTDLERAILAARNPHLPRAWIRPNGDAQQLRRAREELSRARQELADRRGEAP